MIEFQSVIKEADETSVDNFYGAKDNSFDIKPHRPNQTQGNWGRSRNLNDLGKSQTSYRSK